MPNLILLPAIKLLHMLQEASSFKGRSLLRGRYQFNNLPVSVSRRHTPALTQLQKPEMHQNITAMYPDYRDRRAHIDE
jgi:hypothetical protein